MNRRTLLSALAATVMAPFAKAVASEEKKPTGLLFGSDVGRPVIRTYGSHSRPDIELVPGPELRRHASGMPDGRHAWRWNSSRLVWEPIAWREQWAGDVILMAETLYGELQLYAIYGVTDVVFGDDLRGISCTKAVYVSDEAIRWKDWGDLKESSRYVDLKPLVWSREYTAKVRAELEKRRQQS